MKRISRIAPWLVVAGATSAPLLVACASSPSASSSTVVVPAAQPLSVPPIPAAAREPRDVLLYDDDAKDPRVTMYVAEQRLAPSAQTKLLDLVFGTGKYLADRDGCATSPPAPQERAFAPSVWEGAPGSFTKPKSKQMLYLIVTGECGASHADSWGSSTLAVVENDALVAKGKLPGGTSLHRVVDIEGDGKDEIVLTTGFTNQGFTTVSASLAHFDSQSLAPPRDLGKVHEDTCGAAPRGEKKVVVVRAHVPPNQPMSLRLETKAWVCED